MEPVPAGMKKIHSAGRSFQQGWNDTLASLDERPGMASSFTYDYWIDSTEVTQKRYFDLTGKRPVSDTSMYGTGDAFPVYFVTWFDAALFCNARSRAESLDSVYFFSGIKPLPGGGVYELIGCRSDCSRNGYRLPTEAEWEFAARGGSSGQPIMGPADSGVAEAVAWYAANSSDKTHCVATKQPNQFGLYDMAGNVFEWTNDWKGVYNGEGMVNCLGAPLPDAGYEKVIKGGSYNHGMAFLRPSHRSATYVTTLSSANEYVGFRCVRGAIPGGRYIGTSRGDFVPNPVSIAADAAAIRKFTKATGARVVFVNVTGSRRTLCAVDLGAILPSVREFTDEWNVHMPTISPDGHFAAYCSGSEGRSGPSAISIRSIDSLGSPVMRLPCDSGYVPRWWVDRSIGDTFIVYTNSAVENSNALWKSGGTFLQKISAGSPVGGSRAIIMDGSYHDGLSPDKRIMVTGYDRLMARDLLTNEEKQLFLPPGNGKDAGGSSQVCNVSISPDTGLLSRCLFLDFGYPRTSTITGCSYGIHQYLFISSFSDSVSAFLLCPTGERSWDYPEWSNRDRFAVACARNGAEQSHMIYFVDLIDKKFLPVMTGMELEQPGLWIGPVADSVSAFDFDSIGVYDDPHVDWGQSSFADVLHFFWQQCSGLDIVFVGQSQIQMGIDCSAFKTNRAFDFAFPGCGLSGVSNIISNYVLPHAQKAKIIGITIPFYNFANPLAEDTPDWWNNTIGRSKGYQYDKNHNFWRDSLPSGFWEAMKNAPYPNLPGKDTCGFVPVNCNGWGGAAPDMAGNVAWTVEDSIYKENLTAFERLIKDVSARGVHLLGIVFPESPYYKSTDHYLRYGPSRETGTAIMQQLRALETRYPYFHVYDANNGGNHDYADADAHDWNHLCTNGAAKLSARLDSLIQEIGRSR